MKFGALRGLLSEQHRAALAFGAAAHTTNRLAFVATAARLGVLSALHATPSTAGEVAELLEVPAARGDDIRSWLDIGVATGVLADDDGRYRPRNARIRAIARGGLAAATLRESWDLHARTIAAAPQLLAAGEQLALSPQDEIVIAESSGILEPLVAESMSRILPARGQQHVLEVGCGSGCHTVAACRRNPSVTVLAIDRSPAVVERARDRVADAGCADRVRFAVRDFDEQCGAGIFDVVTFHNNIYYFPREGLASVLEHARRLLRPGGRVVVTTSVARGSVGTVLDLAVRMSAAGTALPTRHELETAMRGGGLAVEQTLTLLPGGGYLAVIGRRPTHDRSRT